jgi:hypothetical protein
MPAAASQSFTAATGQAIEPRQTAGASGEGEPGAPFFTRRFFVAPPPVQDLLLCAKHLLCEANRLDDAVYVQSGGSPFFSFTSIRTCTEGAMTAIGAPPKRTIERPRRE